MTANPDTSPERLVEELEAGREAGFALPDGRIGSRLYGMNFSTAFQPIILLENSGLLGHEALLRFVGKDSHLSLWVLLDALASDEAIVHIDRTLRVIHALNFSRQNGQERLFLNVHPGLLQKVPEDHGRYFRRALRTLGHHGAVVLELNLRGLHGREHVFAAVRNYRSQGFEIALDGFHGTNLEYALIEAGLPDRVKLHRSLVALARRDDGCRRRLKNLVADLESLGMPTIAVGIETWDDLALVMDLGVEAGQGFLLGRPTPRAGRPQAPRGAPAIDAGWSDQPSVPGLFSFLRLGANR